MGRDKNERHSQTGKSLFGAKAKPDSGIGFDWGTTDAERLQRLIGLITGRGGAVRFGYSRDGGAGSIGVYYGDSRDTLYIRPSDDLEDTLALIERTFEALPYTGGKAPGAGELK